MSKVNSIARPAILADLGRKYPPEFLETIADDGFDKALEWLRKHECPEEICNLIGNAYFVATTLPEIQNGAPCTWDAAGLAEAVPEMLETLAVLGATFGNSVTDSIARTEPPPFNNWRAGGEV